MIDYTVQSASEINELGMLIYVVLLSFILSTSLAYVYQKTFRGLSYSRNYVQAIVLISIIAATVIQSVGDSLARGIGIMAAMAIIRFRTNLKDPRDTLFLFASLAAGIACGAYSFEIAILGTVGFSMAALLLYYSPFGPTSFFDGMLRFSIEIDDESGRRALENLLQKHCKTFSLVTLREIGQGQRMDYAYHIKLKKKTTHEAFLQDLQMLKTIEGVSFMMQEATVDL
ncbi:MAG TPA: DUF4956 domain-containing protein [Gammaproteobacteria bacterium]|nr:DUF4956 domain-containing protein [Gammaproteobacteria bacterium]